MLKQWKFKGENLFLISDLHFNHDVVLDKRGFKTTQEHDETLIKRWNEWVKHDSTVLFLGDFIFRSNMEHALSYINRLNGTIYHLFGNHNSGVRQLYKHLVNIQFHVDEYHEVYPVSYNKLNGGDFIFVGDYMSGYIDNIPFVASHFPFRIWDGIKKNSLHFSGHSHGGDKESNPNWLLGKRLDVGVENFGRPISWKEAIEIMNKKKVVSVDLHH